MSHIPNEQTDEQEEVYRSPEAHQWDRLTCDQCGVEVTDPNYCYRCGNCGYKASCNE